MNSIRKQRISSKLKSMRKSNNFERKSNRLPRAKKISRTAESNMREN